MGHDLRGLSAIMNASSGRSLLDGLLTSFTRDAPAQLRHLFSTLASAPSPVNSQQLIIIDEG
jgi:hypothetical protein